MNATSARGGCPTLRRLHGKLSPRLTGLPYLADRATRLGGSPHLSCKRDQNKIRNYMDKRVIPPRRVTSPTWGPPPPCKQALKIENRLMGLSEFKLRTKKTSSAPDSYTFKDMRKKDNKNKKKTGVHGMSLKAGMGDGKLKIGNQV